MVRIKKDYSKGFTTMNNTIVRDDSLSWKARGIFAYLWSMPDDWNFYETEVAKHATDGRQSLRTGLEELEKNGYLERTRSRDKLGKFGAPVWVLHDEPATTHSPMSDYPTLDKPTSDYPTSGNRTLLNKYLTKETSTNEIQEERDVYKAPLDKNEKLSFIHWPSSLGAMTDQITRLLLSAQEQGMSDAVIQMIIDKTRMAKPNTTYGYLKKVIDDYLGQGIYTTADFRRKQDRRRQAEHREIPNIPVFKID